MAAPAEPTVVIVDGMWPPQQRGLYPGNADYLTPGGDRVGQTVVHVGTETLKQLRVGDVLERDGEKILVKSLEPIDQYGRFDSYGRIEVARGYLQTPVKQHPMQSTWIHRPFRV